ncbi:helix-turn-helix domain-containing protein [Pseudovibrio brasiliensis]|uniref:Helix-turn-helix domain-containing protein n=1 Tax=Pseudovibrio brasiliensis TaxID=1898042 RepID=A0ABX8AUT1_9HYPH|nr:helix-turn-helix domain-containing protein [Pseudovibrio brasiliensis]QUS57339.1 helix-turn-helix domain-containing protein [Pseudovibrio brasiliensis]
MTTADKRKWSYVPIGIYGDPELSPRDKEVMGVLCSSTNRFGVCCRSMVQIAELLRVGRTTVHRAIHKLMKAGWLERSGGKRKNGGDCSFTYRVIHKDLPEDDQDDLPEPDLEKEAVRLEENCFKNGQTLSAQADTYYNELNITIDDEQVAASGVNEEKTDVSSPAKPHADGSFKRYANEVVSTLARLKPGLDVGRMAGGINPIMGWFTVGCNLDLDVKPALAIVLERAPALPNSLNYFTKAVVSAMKSREELSQINPSYQNFGAQAAAKRMKERNASRERCNAAIDELSAEFAAGGAL